MSDLHFSPRPNRAHEIRWREWGDAAFEEARSSGKPVLLAISAVWCHWCHVMDETTYSTQDVIDTINGRFVAVRVDNDRRPDVNARYNQGGWPTTAILTPDGDLLKGATYVPPDQMHQLLAQIDAFYADASNRATIAEHVADVRRRRAQTSSRSAGALKPDIPDRVFSFLDANFDERFGGFGTDQKFPQTQALHFLLDRYARRKDARTEEIAARTLHAMAEGGMYDRVHGGFYRYSTTRDYTVPHFEKMLEDLGGLMLACARAAALFDDESLARVAVDVRSYLDTHLWNAAAGAYGGSQDADEEYYALDAAGRAAARAPYVDPTVYTSWNAETARALIVAGPLLARWGTDSQEWTQRGLAVLETLWTRLRDDGLMCRYFDGDGAHVRGLLGDQAWMAWASIAAHEATGDRRWLDRSAELVRTASVLYDRDARAYADRLADGPQTARLAERAFPLDENALMARCLSKLAVLGHDDEAPARARSVLEGYVDSYRAYGMFASAYAAAVLDVFEPPLRVEVVGRGTSADALRQAARRAAAPPLSIIAAGDSPITTPAASSGQPFDGRPYAQICDDSACFARATSPDEIERALSQAAASHGER